MCAVCGLMFTTCGLRCAVCVLRVAVDALRLLLSASYACLMFAVYGLQFAGCCVQLLPTSTAYVYCVLFTSTVYCARLPLTFACYGSLCTLTGYRLRVTVLRLTVHCLLATAYVLRVRPTLYCPVANAYCVRLVLAAVVY